MKKILLPLLVASMLLVCYRLATAQSSSQPVPNYINTALYDPVHYTCTTGANFQLRNGYNVYDIDGATVVGCTVQLPSAPVDGQFIRLSIGTGLTITTLTITDGNTGAVLATLASVLAGSTPQWQMQGSTYRRIGS